MRTPVDSVRYLCCQIGLTFLETFAELEPTYYDWSKDKLSRWLQDHKVAYGPNLNAEQLRDLVHQNYEKAYQSWYVLSLVSSYPEPIMFT